MQNYEPFVSYEGLEQLHRFIFVMAITHISYSCLTMLLAIVKVVFDVAVYSMKYQACYCSILAQEATVTWLEILNVEELLDGF